MRIKSLKIHNFRSIREIDMECLALTTLLGPNNHGKSNLLSALEFGLTTSAKPMEQDFFAYRGAEEDEFWVEMVFKELTEQEQKTFERYLLADRTICIRKTAKLKPDGVETFYNGYAELPEEEWLQTQNAGDYTSREKVNLTPLQAFVPPTGRLTKAMIEEAQQKYISENRKELNFTRSLEQGPLLGQKNVGGGVLPDFYLIPAVKDLTDEIKVKTTTTFGRLLNRAVREMAERDPRLAEARKQLEEVVTSLNTREREGEQENQLAVLEKSIEAELRSWGVKVNIEVTPPEIERIFELGTDVHLNDGVKTRADRKGHGLQRALMFALLRAWAKALRDEKQLGADGQVSPRKQSDSVIFAMEEPELFLHPHAQRRLASSLRAISATPEHQVFVCTHSTFFVDLEHYKEVAIINKSCPEKGTCVRQCTRDLFEGEDIEERKKKFHMAKWINPDRGEMFFARRVVFVEGETESVILPYLAEKMGVFNPNVSVIDCGSKHNLPLYIAVAKAFEIPYLVIHDEDPLPDPVPHDWGDDKVREKRRTFELNGEIERLVEPPLGSVEVFPSCFEEAAGVSKNQGKKKGKALAALDHFEAIEPEAVSEQLRRVVCKAFVMEEENS